MGAIAVVEHATEITVTFHTPLFSPSFRELFTTRSTLTTRRMQEILTILMTRIEKERCSPNTSQINAMLYEKFKLQVHQIYTKISNDNGFTKRMVFENTTLSIGLVEIKGYVK